VTSSVKVGELHVGEGDCTSTFLAGLYRGMNFGLVPLQSALGLNFDGVGGAAVEHAD